MRATPPAAGAGRKSAGKHDERNVQPVFEFANPWFLRDPHVHGLPDARMCQQSHYRGSGSLLLRLRFCQ